MRYILTGYFFCIILFVCSCNISFTQEEKPKEDALNMLPSFCQTPVMDVLLTPDANAKPIARLHLGDEIKLLGDTVSIKYGDKVTRYHKVQLLDKAVGWAPDDSLAIHWRRAAIKDATNAYSRPDTTTAGIGFFDRADFVFVSPTGRGMVHASGRSGRARKM